MNAPSLPQKRHCVLIVDDDCETRRQLSVLLAAEGFDVVEAANGRVAPALLAEGVLDLVLTDIFMPVCDGFELLAAIRRMEHPVPVIAMSDRESWTGLNFFDAANDLGAAAVIQKPVPQDELLRLARQVISAKPRTDSVVSLASWSRLRHA
jgi:CheY-like chemotaxis protein